MIAKSEQKNVETDNVGEKYVMKDKKMIEEGERFAVADPGQEIGLEGDELLVDEAVDEVEEHLLFFAEVGAGLS